MTSQKKDKGFLKIPNEIAEAFQLLHLSGNQWRLLWVIIRLTYGWNKSVDRIALSIFEERTRIERRNLKRDLDVMVERNIINKDASGYITKYGIQEDFTKWETGVKNNTSVKNHTTTSVDNNTKTSVKNDIHKRHNTIKDIPNSIEVRNDASKKRGRKHNNSMKKVLAKECSDLSLLLYELILKRNPGHKKPDIKAWAIHIDKMIRLDDRDIEEIGKVIHWCQEDSFWQNNILSTSKLRDKYDHLKLKMNAEKGGERKNNEVVL